MSGGEIAWRARNVVRQLQWWRRMGNGWRVPAVTGARWAGGSVPAGTGVGAAGADNLLACARRLLEDGSWPVFDRMADLSGADPDWFADPDTGRRAPAGAYCFTVPFRDQGRVGNVKYVWEMGRLHHLTVLAVAYHLSGEEAFAARALDHLRSWCRANPPLRGIHWTSGIEIGLRLLSLIWTRRLLDRWPGIAAAFEDDPAVRRQLHAHQAWIATFASQGSSANNHLVAEMAGLLAASRALPLFAASPGWARLASARLECEIVRQTFADGLNCELAGDYHVFVSELFLVAGIEADATGAGMSEHYWAVLATMLDALAATVDVAGNPARQGDGDDARAVLLAAPGPGTHAVLGTSAQLLGAASWWPQAGAPSDIGAALLASMGKHRPASGRAAARTHGFAAAGITILRDLAPTRSEIWCRFDHGPHGMPPTYAHAHADALSFELRFGGQPILVDPGTYCYHGEKPWRDYFRSTVAHNTLELDGTSQAETEGPFLWRTAPTTELIAVSGLAEGRVASVEARHDGYRRLNVPALHRRRLTLDRRQRRLVITDWIETSAPASAGLAFHLHPAVQCRLEANSAALSWIDDSGCWHRALLCLPATLAWSAHCGETDPILGWYSAHFGARCPTIALVGRGAVAPGRPLETEIMLPDDVASPVFLNASSEAS